MRVRNFGVLLMALALGTSAAEMRADTLFSNFGPGQTYVGNSWWNLGGEPGVPSQAVAFPFVPTETATVTGADLALAGLSAGTTPVNVYIAANSGGAPGGILDTLTESVSTPIPTYPVTAVVNFGCSGSCTTLTAGTTYWIVGNESNPNELAYWLYSFGDTGTWFYNYANSATGPWLVATAGDNFSAFDVTGTLSTIPEPGSVVLLGSGLVGVLAAVRRRAWRLRAVTAGGR